MLQLLLALALLLLASHDHDHAQDHHDHEHEHHALPLLPRTSSMPRRSPPTTVEQQQQQQAGPPAKRLFVFGGSGFVGARLVRAAAALAPSEFERVSSTALRRTTVARDFEGNGSVVEHVLRDGTLTKEAWEDLREATHVVSTIPPKEGGEDPVVRAVAAVAMRGRLVWAAYLSTTGVYGDAGGAVVTEDSPLKPANERSKWRVRSEQEWLQSGAPAHIFRLPGLYGPTRGPLSKMRAVDKEKKLIVKENHVFGRIHVDDVVGGLLLSMRSPNPGRVYNLCDDVPEANHVVSLFACELIGRPLPTLVKFEEAEMSPMARSFYAECKRVSNERMKRELGFVCTYPSYREGMAAQLEEELRLGIEPGEAVAPSVRRAKDASAASALPPSSETPFHEDVVALVMALWHRARAALMRLWIVLKLWLARRSCDVVLVDNGSVRAPATLGMRRLARLLSHLTPGNMRVEPISLRFANRVPKTDLEGEPASVLVDTDAVRAKTAGASHVAVVPLFLGPSAAVTREIPLALDAALGPLGIRFSVAKPLVDLDVDEDFDPSSCRVTRMLARAAAREGLTENTRIVLVDHGSPNIRVTHVRRALAARLRRVLSPLPVWDCSMERRPEREYDFNEPLLERVFDLGGLGGVPGPVVVVPAFLFAGNHAGAGGDDERILDAARDENPELTIRLAGLLFDEANDDVALELLRERLESVVEV